MSEGKSHGLLIGAFLGFMILAAFAALSMADGIGAPVATGLFGSVIGLIVGLSIGKKG